MRHLLQTAAFVGAAALLMACSAAEAPPKFDTAAMDTLLSAAVNKGDVIGVSALVFDEGETVYTKQLPDSGILVMGNEANGVSKAIEAIINEKISIPRFGDLQATESLNVATATAILLSEFRRKLVVKL